MTTSRALVGASLFIALAACQPAITPDSDPAPSGPTAMIAAAPAATPTGSPAGIQTGRVLKVTDGDTIHVAVNGGPTLDVRVVGEDSPEVVKPHTPVQCFGPQASAEAHRLMDGQTVTLRPDPTQAQVDRYGRALRYVTLPDGEDLSLHMVTGGWSRAYKLSRGPVPTEWPQLASAQQQALTAKRGLWGPRPGGCGGGV